MCKSLKVLFLLAVVGFSFNNTSYGQNGKKADSTYYDSWVGEWFLEVNGELQSTPSFIVKPSLYPGAFEEYWLKAGGTAFSVAWRAWDTRTKKWDLAWMSTDGHFQLWSGKKVDDVWYIYNTFLIEGKEVLSRQAFIPQGADKLIRTSEHSYDGGNTWKLRFKETYRKNSK